jgi:hypothetical protein
MAIMNPGTDNEAIRDTRDFMKTLSQSSFRLEEATKKLNQSTDRLVKLTGTLISLTAILAVAAIVDILSRAVHL